MRKTYTLIVMLAMMFVGMNSVSAQVTQGDYTFGFYSSGKAYISAYTGTDTEITIPVTLTYDKEGVETTVDVVGFGTNAFAGNTTIEKIYLPNNGIYTTGASAFKGCTALNTIAYSYSGAGTAITRDNYITIPTPTLNASVFEGCTSIQNVYARYSMTGGVGNNVFKGCTSLLTASISAACKSIGESAFEGCTALTTVEGCNGGTASGTSYGPATIGKNAFKDCVSLIRYGATAGRVSIYTAEVGEGAFENCQAITRFLVSASLGNGGFPVPKNCFKGCVALDSIAQSVYIGTIGESAFEGCTSLRRTSGITGVNKILYFPYSTSIGMNAFKGCTTFDRIWAVKLENIGESAFEDCTSMTAIYKNSSETFVLKTIGANAFKNCTKFNYIGSSSSNGLMFPSTMISIGASAFAGCDAITKVVAPWTTPIVITEDVFSTTVYENATLDYPEASLDAYKAATGWQKFFKDASAFTAVFNLLGTDGETVVGAMKVHIKTNETGGAMIYNDDVVAAQKLDGDAGILDLREVKDAAENIYPLVEIGKNAFKGVADITDVWLTDNTLTTIGESAFENCENLVAFSSNASAASVINIGAYAFKGTPLYQMGNLLGKYQAATSTYSTANSPLTIGDEAFKGTRIQFVVNGNNIRQLGEGVFEDCTMLKNNGDSILYLSNAALTTIPARTFKNCKNLVYVSGGINNKTAIGESAFEGCTKLARVTMDTTGPSTGYLRLSNKLTAIGANAFKDCPALSVIILNTLTPPTLGEDAFTGIKANSSFYINPNNSYKSASKYALNDGWKVFFNGSKGSNYLIVYVNKEKQYGTVSCDVPLYFYTTTTIANLYKVIASSDNYAYMEAVSSKRLPANTGAVIDVEVDGTVKTSTAVQVLFSTVSATDWSDNLLVANVTENTGFVGQETDGTYNLLLSDGKFVKATDGTLAAGLAYLPMNFGGGEAKELSLTTDEPTGIKTIDNGEPTVDNGAWYTIDGKRLQGEPTTKGIYIKNGKKIVVK